MKRNREYNEGMTIKGINIKFGSKNIKVSQNDPEANVLKASRGGIIKSKFHKSFQTPQL